MAPFVSEDLHSIFFFLITRDVFACVCQPPSLASLLPYCLFSPSTHPICSAVLVDNPGVILLRTFFSPVYYHWAIALSCTPFVLETIANALSTHKYYVAVLHPLRPQWLLLDAIALCCPCRGPLHGLCVCAQSQTQI